MTQSDFAERIAPASVGAFLITLQPPQKPVQRDLLIPGKVEAPKERGRSAEEYWPDIG